MVNQTSTNPPAAAPAPIKFTLDHPAFQRTAKFLHDQVEKCRPSAIKIATRVIIGQGIGLTTENLTTRIAEEVDRLEMVMFKRLARKHGLTGKYVAH